MWLGEQMTEYGIGNGISLIIMAGIVARLPVAHRASSVDSRRLGVRRRAPGKVSVLSMLMLVALFVFIVAGVVLITQAPAAHPDAAGQADARPQDLSAARGTICRFASTRRASFRSSSRRRCWSSRR